MAPVAASMVNATSLSSNSCQASIAGFERLRKLSSHTRHAAVAFRPSISVQRLHICCAKADAVTVEKVKCVICKQLAMDSKDVLPDSKFADLGADSLDTVEIMMALEEQFDISLSQDGSEKIATVQDAADLIQEVCNAQA